MNKAFNDIEFSVVTILNMVEYFMGIDVSAKKAVSLNPTHEHGVDTSINNNPSRSRQKGMNFIHVFSRNQKGPRRDDGNPLIHALKAQKGFSITPYWERQFMMIAETILGNVQAELAGYDCCMPIPSSSPFCRKFAELVSQVSGRPVLEPTFLRKKCVGEILNEIEANPPRVRQGLKVAFTSQVHAWGKLDPAAPYQAKEIDVSLRQLFSAFTPNDGAPNLGGKKVLLVDDLYATGSSALSVRETLENQHCDSVAGVCFLSGV